MLKKIYQKYDKKLETDFLPDALEIVEKPASPLGHLVIWVTVIIIVVAIVWASVGRMDEIAIASAKVIPKNGVQVIQPLYEGIVTDILVEEGEYVIKGQDLIKLDTTEGQIEITNMEEKISDLELQNKLVELMITGNDISSYASDNSIVSYGELQIINLMISMQSEHELQKSQYMSQYDQNLKQLDIEKNNLEKLNQNLSAFKQQKYDAEALYSGSTPENQTLENYKLQLEKAEYELKEYQKLYDIGAVAKYQLDEKQNVFDEAYKQYELQEVRAEHEKAGNTAEISELQRQIDILKKDVSAQEKEVQKQSDLVAQCLTSLQTLETEYNQNLSNILVSNNSTLNDYNAELMIKHTINKSQILTAPTDGIVQTIAVTTVGGVVTAAQPIVSIVPDGAELIVEADVLNRDIGYVFIGQAVSVKLDSFSFQKYGTVDGKIIYVSPSATEDERKGLIYKIKIEIDKSSFDVNGIEVPISSGMSGTAEIKLEERRVIEFFLEPVFEYFDNSLKVR